MFSFWLSKKSGSDTSVMTLGGYNSGYFTGELQWHDLISPSYWLIGFEDLMINNHSVAACWQMEGGQCQAVVDTGTSLIAGPSDVLGPIVDQVSMLVKSDCSNIDSPDLPDVTLTIGGVPYVLNARDYVLRIKLPLIGKETCIAGFLPLDLPPKLKNFFILGDVFISSFYTAFDYGAKRIGFARAKQMD